MSDHLTLRLHNHEAVALQEFLKTERDASLKFIASEMTNLLNSRVDPEDVFQEVCLTAIREFDNVCFETISPIQWLRKIAEQRIVDSYRRHVLAQQRSVTRTLSISKQTPQDSHEDLEALLAASITSPSAAFSRNQRMTKFEEVFERFSATERTALILCRVDKLTFEEIAARLGKTSGAWRTTISRIEKRIREALQLTDEFRKD